MNIGRKIKSHTFFSLPYRFYLYNRLPKLKVRIAHIRIRMNCYPTFLHSTIQIQIKLFESIDETTVRILTGKKVLN